MPAFWSTFRHQFTKSTLMHNHGDLHVEFDRLYRALIELLNTYYPERSTTIKSADLSYATPSTKCMLWQKNKLMRAGRVEQAAVLAVKTGEPIKMHNNADLTWVAVLSDPKSMWTKVRQLTCPTNPSSTYPSDYSPIPIIPIPTRLKERMRLRTRSVCVPAHCFHNSSSRTSHPYHNKSFANQSMCHCICTGFLQGL